MPGMRVIPNRDEEGLYRYLYITEAENASVLSSEHSVNGL
jgi:hypothetical protein